MQVSDLAAADCMGPSITPSTIGNQLRLTLAGNRNPLAHSHRSGPGFEAGACRMSADTSQASFFSQSCFPPCWLPSQAELPFEGTSWPRRHPHSSQPGRRMFLFPLGFQSSPQLRLSLGRPGALRLWRACPAKESDEGRSRRERYHENR